MQKIPKIYFIVSLVVLISPFLILSGLLLSIPDYITDIFIFTVLPVVVLLAPILFFVGLYLAFFPFSNDPARKSYIRWGIYINLVSTLLFFLSSLMSLS